MNPNQHPKGLSNVIFSLLFQEICTKIKNIVSLPLILQKNCVIYSGFATVQSSTCTTYEKYQRDLRGRANSEIGYGHTSPRQIFANKSFQK